MADTDLQSLLDPTGTGRGIQIVRRTNDTTLKSSYYLVPNVTLAGRARWVQVTTADSDEDKDTAIRAALA
jgi:hypothetical protein